MRRLRLLFAFFAAALLALLVLLVRRAASSAALEREMRHRALAERLFDEMERDLSRFLEHEEESSFHLAVGVEERNEFPFLVSRFEERADEVVGSTPPEGKKDDDKYALAVEGDGGHRVHAFAAPESANEELALAKEQIPRAVQRATEEQRPGSTLPLGSEAAEPSGKLRKERSSSYDAFRSLNKAVEERAAQRRLAESSELADKPNPRADDAAQGLLRDSYSARRDRPAVAATAPARKSAAAAAAPLAGRVIEPGWIVLSRNVVRDGRLQRQGVVLALQPLEAWLRARTFGDATLAAHSELAFSVPFAAASAPSASGAFFYRHRFAEPFADLSAELALQPLPGLGSASYVYLLSALLLATAGLGLVALYRMVSVVVSFAERRSNFVAAVTHELKTPLTAIRMYGEMLRDGMVPTQDKRDEYYRHITAESERLSRLINNVLEFSHLENGDREVTLVRGDVAPVLREAADLLRPHVAERGFVLAVEVEADLPPVRFERDALVQVLFNLVDNAVKYARGASDRRIELAAVRAGAAVCICVRDNGPGVAPRNLDRIFEAFYRGESELTRRNKGTGLGLALVRGLVQRMDGGVRAHNRREGGFEVEIELG